MSFVELTGHAKLDRRTKNLVKRLSADDIAIIDHTDLDRVSAEELAESGVRVVVNVARSQSGRFPNPGPLALVRAGVRLIDVASADLFENVHEGELLTVRGAGLYRNGTCLASGRVLDEPRLAGELADRLPVWDEKAHRWTAVHLARIGTGMPDPLPRSAILRAPPNGEAPVWIPDGVWPELFADESLLARRAERWLLEAPLPDPRVFVRGRLEGWSDGALLAGSLFRRGHQACVGRY